MNRENAKQLMLEVGSILDEAKIPFFLMQGTSLGAYRDHGFVPTEKDVDFGVLRENFTSYTVLHLTTKLTQLGHDIELIVRPFHYVRTLVVWGVNCKMDLVSWAVHGDKRYAACPVREWITEPYCIVHNRSMIENYQELEVFGRTWKVPSPIEEYLQLEYGSGWRTPKEDHISRTRVYDFLKKEGLPK